MNSDFKDLLFQLKKHQVRFLVVGGYAVILYTEPRYTKDLDIVVGNGPGEPERVAMALADFGFPMSPVQIEELKLPNQMIVLGRPPSRIDILNELTGVDFDSAWQRRNLVIIDGLEVPFVAKDDLIAAKRAAGRPQDMLDISKLERLEG